MHRRSALIGAIALLATPHLARAQPTPVRLSHGYGLHFLPMMVIRDHRLLQAQAKRLGLAPIDVQWRTLDGGSTIDDAMLAGALDIAGTGAPGFIAQWARGQGTDTAVTGICALGTGALWLNTNRPAIHSLADFTPDDRIAVPATRSSLAATLLQIACARTFGIEHRSKLDALTVSLPHPAAMAALLTGQAGITAHFASPPFCNQELAHPFIHCVITTTELLGRFTIDVVCAKQRFADANPGLMTAFLAAKQQADEFIAHDSQAAIDSFMRTSGVKLTPSLLLQVLDDPETRFSTAPRGVMKYADFLYQTHRITRMPATWKDLFLPQLHDLTGS